MSVDPLREKYPELTTYQFASNTPIQAIDLDGAEMLKMIKDIADEVYKSTSEAAKLVVKKAEDIKRTAANYSSPDLTPGRKFTKEEKIQYGHMAPNSHLVDYNKATNALKGKEFSKLRDGIGHPP